MSSSDSVVTHSVTLEPVVEASRFIPDAYMDLLVNYEPEHFRNAVTALAGRMESTESIENAGKLVIAEVVRASGSLTTYLYNVGHRLSPRVKEFLSQNLSEFDSLLKDNAELNYRDHDFFSASTLAKSYLLRPDFGEMPVESPLQLYLRVASHLYAEEGVDRVKRAFFEMANHLYTHASPTLFNAGTKKPQGSSCFLMELGDDLDSILGTGVRDAGLISQHKGGLGIGLGRLRHSAIGDAGMASGVTPVARILDKMVTYVDQGGARAGAGNVYLPIWHIDIWDFVNSTNNFGQSQALRLQHLNTTIWMHDLFFSRVAKDEKWTVFCPAKASLFGLYGIEFEKAYIHFEALAAKREAEYEKAVEVYRAARQAQMADPDSAEKQRVTAEALTTKRFAKRDRIDHKVYSARDILNHISDVEIKSGFPFIMNGDAANAKTNQANIGKVNSGNLCVEICEVSTPSTTASCNLASISLRKYARKSIDKQPLDSTEAIVKSIAESGAYDFDALGASVRSIVENLDRVIEYNLYPVPDKTQDLNLLTRPLGIGVSGFDDAVKILDFEFESAEAEALNKAIFACMYFNALVASVNLAIVRGEYAEFRTGSFTLPRALSESPPPGTCQASSYYTEGLLVFETFSGSPASNGFLQFDLWDRDAGVKKVRGTLDEPIYRRSDDIPISPKTWGQKAISLKDGKASVIIKPTWESIRESVIKFGLRNSLLLTVMPTASTAQILRNAESTEVHASNIYTRTVTSGHYTIVNPHLVKDLEAIGLWNQHTISFLEAFGGSLEHFHDFVSNFQATKYPNVTIGNVSDRLKFLKLKYKNMFEISQKVILRYSRQRAIYIDQSQSLNIHLMDPTKVQVQAVHTMGNKLGLKTGIYYLRQRNDDVASSFTLSAEMLKYKESVKGYKQIEKTPVAACPIDPAARAECLSCQ
jgi:ribonucleotide reductase alpha subunit